MKRLHFLIVFLLLGFISFSGCASIKGESAGEYLDDSTITTQVNAIIVKDPDARYLKIDVTTTKGEVVLQGFIKNRETESRLVAKIRALAGVKSVNSLLKLEVKK